MEIVAQAAERLVVSEKAAGSWPAGLPEEKTWAGEMGYQPENVPISIFARVS